MHTTVRKEREYRGRGVNFGKLSEIGNPLPCVAKSWQNQKTSFRKKTGGCFRVLPQFLPPNRPKTCQTHSTKSSLMTGCRGFRGVQSTPLKKENKAVRKWQFESRIQLSAVADRRWMKVYLYRWSPFVPVLLDPSGLCPSG